MSIPLGSPGPWSISVRITVNGEPREVSPGMTVALLIEDLKLPAQFVAVERNRRVIPRREHAEARLEAGDELEVVTLVGGG